MATTAVAKSRIELFINSNRLRTDDWVAPPINPQLNLIHDKVLAFPTTRGRLFKQLLAHKGMALAVIVMATPSEQVLQVEPGHDSVFGEWQTLPIIPCRVFFKSNVTRFPAPGFLLPTRRFEIAKRKFSLRNGGAVVGPYLAVMAYEIGTGLVVRARLWPIWISPDHKAMNVVRSSPERSAQHGFYAAGATGFSPMRLSDAEVLQRALGHRWKGDLTAYKHLADNFLFPSAGQLITVFELFAMQNMKRYDAGKAEKELDGNALKACALARFESIDARKKRADLVEKEAYELILKQPAVWKPVKWEKIG